MKLHSFHDLYLNQLKDLYDAENRINKALPKMIQASGTAELRSALEEHLRLSRGHIERLDQIFRSRGESPGGETCDAIKGIIEEGEELSKADSPDKVRDAGIIAAAQRVEHYEIAVYGTVRTFARRLGYQNDERLLQQTLDEEEAADKKLTSVAEAHVNPELTRTA